jgi:hypothetical protein
MATCKVIIRLAPYSDKFDKMSLTFSKKAFGEYDNFDESHEVAMGKLLS